MEKSIIQVEGMSCEHCVRAVKNAVGALNGVSDVTVDLKGKTVTVEHEGIVSRDQITAEIEDQGYDVVG